ncbi:MAG TPA: triphosphoribosyl-dephospho-CoA synthase, partial [Candidatus Pullilachnospira stercoravium]|nr:triphosphoribosyl-dephospho-CoA synthase [Candidatus Pullilachnospira stercoravium]
MKSEDGFAGKLGRIAKSALLEEVYTTPKPGLVDVYSNGAHKDMNVSTFLRSAAVLEPFFTVMAAQGIRHCQELPLLMKKIRKVGQYAESAMYKAT